MGESREMRQINSREYNRFLTCLFNRALIRFILVGIIASIVGVLLLKGSTISLLSLCILPGILFIVKPFIGIYSMSLIDILHSYHESEISIRTIILIFILLMAVITIFYRKKIEGIKSIKNIMIVVSAFLIWIVIVDYLIIRFPLDSFYKTAAWIFVPVLIGFTIFYFINDLNKLKIMINIFLIGMFVSAFIGILQFFFGGLFWQLNIYNKAFKTGTIYGLAAFTYIYSSQLTSTIPLLFSKYLTAKKRKNIYLLGVVLMISALLLTVERSSIYGCLLSLFVCFILITRKKITFKMVAFFILILFSLYIVINFAGGERLVTAEGSALGRIPLWISSLYIAMDNPLGVGHDKYKEAVIVHAWKVSHYERGGIVYTTTPHNQFLKVLTNWGLPGLILLILFYYYLLKKINNIRKSTQNKDFRILSIGLFCSLLSYIINSVFHNLGPFIGDAFHWYFIGMSLSLIRISKQYS
ncbi:MAG: O-antigen ligase family protein [Nitrospirae bacterium]|nr:O-antigen ligase family protein [Nitrospirota bacterium]